MVAGSPCQNPPRVAAPIEKEEEEGSPYSPFRQGKILDALLITEGGGGTGGHAVAQFVEALLNKSGGRRFNSE
jgi:hypothetical protein